MNPPKRDVMGVEVTALPAGELADALEKAVRAGGRGRIACAVNVHTWCEATRDAACGEAFRSSFIAWPDGVPITWAARWLGRPIGPRIHGHDLMRMLLPRPVAHYFYGSTPEVLEGLERRVRGEYPGIKIAGLRSPRFSRRAELISDEDEKAIRDAKPGILWVALGAPKQELWMHLNRDRIDVPVMIGVGAAFEILAGRYSRAPKLLQAAGLEWFWRLAQDPARLWRRYLSTNTRFVSTLIAHLLGLRS